MRPLPPPTAPPTGAEDDARAAHATAGAEPLPPPAPADGKRPAAGGAWDLDRVRAYAEWWLRPLLDPAGWVALGTMLLGAVIAGISFGLVVAGFVISFALAFILVGVGLAAAVLVGVGQIARLETVRLGWIGPPIELRAVRPSTRRGVGRVLDILGDPTRWRFVGYVMVNVVAAPMLFGFAAAPYSLALQALSGFTIWDSWSYGIFTIDRLASLVIALPVAAVLAGAGPRLALWIAGRAHDFGSFFLGPDRLAEATERVESLSTQRQDILDAVAHERRRIERNLHDGVQQQLVAIGLDLGMAIDRLDRDPDASRELLVDARGKVHSSIGQLRQLGRGLHPAILEDRGLDAALSAVVSSATIPISVHVEPGLELSMNSAEVAYFVANEAVANVLKHAQARVASIHVAAVGPDRVRITVHDDGGGGADAAAGTGLAGIRARVRALDGTFHVSSPDGGPTTIVAELPRHG